MFAGYVSAQRRLRRCRRVFATSQQQGDIFIAIKTFFTTRWCLVCVCGGEPHMCSYKCMRRHAKNIFRFGDARQWYGNENQYSKAHTYTHHTPERRIVIKYDLMESFNGGIRFELLWNIIWIDWLISNWIGISRYTISSTMPNRVIDHCAEFNVIEIIKHVWQRTMDQLSRFTMCIALHISISNMIYKTDRNPRHKHTITL